MITTGPPGFDLMIMMVNDIQRSMGPKFSQLCFTVEKPLKKPQPAKLTQPGIGPGPTK